MKDELILILDNGDRNPEFDRRARLAFGNPTRVSLENRKDLLLVRYRLATQKTPLHLVNLPPGVSDEACDGATAQFPHALVSQRVERCLRPLHQPPAALHIRLHPLRMPLRPPRRAHLVEQFLDLSGQMAPLTPPAHRVLLSRPARLPQQATRRVPQQADVRRVVHVRFNHERITPPAQWLAKLFFSDLVTALHHQAPHCRQQLGRSSVYYTPREERAENLALMRRMDELSLQYPFYGSRQMARHLGREGVSVGRRRVRRLMRLMGLEAVYRKPRTSAAQPGHRIYPYLLRELTIERPDQVWCADITYIPVTAGFLYLVAVMDWASRHVLAWRLSNTMDTGFCIEALEAALRTGTPEIFNTDQGAQFTSAAFTERVLAAGARCSMDGRGRCLDNVFIERLWRSLKYEAVYLHELADGFEADRVIGTWMTFYSDVRPHSALGGRTPAEAYGEERAA